MLPTIKPLDLKIGQRIIGLDIMRAYAIMSVLVGHCFFIISDWLSPHTLEIIGFFLLDGVGIFFVLSGFLIGGILIESFERYGVRLSTLIHFWMRRWLRTLPLYFVILTFVTAVYFAQGRVTLRIALEYFVFCQSFINPLPRFFGESWSLAVEEWFYLLSPILYFALLFLFSKKQISIFASGIIILIFGVFYRSYLYNHQQFDQYQIHTVLMRLDCLMYGVIMSGFSHYRNTFFKQYRLIFLGLGLLFLSIDFILTKMNLFSYETYLFIKYNFHYPMFSIGVAFTLPYLVNLKLRDGMLTKLIIFISLISYSLYLTHLTVVQKILWNGVKAVLHLNERTTFYEFSRFLFYWLGSFILSYLSYQWIESPFMKMRQYFSIERLRKFLGAKGQ